MKQFKQSDTLLFYNKMLENEKRQNQKDNSSSDKIIKQEDTPTNDLVTKKKEEDKSIISVSNKSDLNQENVILNNGKSTTIFNYKTSYTLNMGENIELESLNTFKEINIEKLNELSKLDLENLIGNDKNLLLEKVFEKEKFLGKLKQKHEESLTTFHESFEYSIIEQRDKMKFNHSNTSLEIINSNNSKKKLERLKTNSSKTFEEQSYGEEYGLKPNRFRQLKTFIELENDNMNGFEINDFKDLSPNFNQIYPKESNENGKEFEFDDNYRNKFSKKMTINYKESLSNKILNNKQIKKSKFESKNSVNDSAKTINSNLLITPFSSDLKEKYHNYNLLEDKIIREGNLTVLKLDEIITVLRKIEDSLVK